MNPDCFSLPKNQRDRYELINSVYNVSHSLAGTATALQITTNTVKAARDWVANGRPPLKKIGRPQAISKNIKYFILINTIFYPQTSAEELSQHIKNCFCVSIGRATLNNARHKLGFKYASRILVLHFNRISLQTRVNFAQWFLNAGINHRTIIFSDESWFVLGPNNYYVWRIPGDDYNTVTRVNYLHPPKVMIWAGIGFNFKTDLIFFTQSVNSNIYIKEAIVGSHLKYHADKAYGYNQWLFQQDNAKPHTAVNTIQALHKLRINTLPQWPPYSPDLSPIEIIWAIMKKRVDKYKPKNIYQLKEIINYVWHKLDYFTIDCLIDSFPFRLQKCIQNNGNEVKFP